MRIIKTLTLIASLLAPQAAFTADLTVSVDGIVEYDNNVFREEHGGEDDVLFRLRPAVRIHEDRGEALRWFVDYEVPFEFAAKNGSELDDIDQRAQGRVTYHVNDRLELFASDDFRYLRGALRNVRVDDVVSGDDTLLINEGRDRITVNDAEAGLRYQWTPRLSSTARVRHNFFDPDRPDRSENWQLSGLTDLSYVLTPRHTVGFGFQYFHQQFDDRTNVVGSKSDTYNAFAQWTYRVDETLSFSLAGGPTIIDVRQDDAAAAAQLTVFPAIGLAAGTQLDGLGLYRADDPVNPATGVLPTDGVVISQVPACPTVTSTGTPVFAGQVCPINPGSVTTAGIVVDPVTDGQAFYDSVRAPVTVMNSEPEGETDTNVNFFGQATVAKQWSENLHTALRYNRTQGTASGIGGTVIRDTVNLSNTWDMTDLWQLALRGDWSLRRSVTDSTSQFLEAGDPAVPGFDPVFAPAGAVRLVTIRGDATEVDTMRYGVSGRLTRLFTRNTSAWVQLTYNRQESNSGTLGRSSDFDDFLGAVGIRHRFDPIKLW